MSHTVGHNIKRMREIRGLTQQDMADAIGLSVTQYGKIERDEADITTDRLERIAEKLGVSASKILDFDENFTITINNPEHSYVMRQSSVNHYKMSEEEKALYEGKIALLSEKIKFLEEKIAFFEIKG